jgi:hypothetical protein
MNLPDTVIYALAVGAVSAAGACFGGWLSSRATKRSSAISLQGISQQLQFQRFAKIAEFRQAWINDLRDAMTEFQSIATAYSAIDIPSREFHKAGTKIELMMNRRDAQYPILQKKMSAVHSAGSDALDIEAWSISFVETCQDILKAEWDVLKRDLLPQSN